MVLSNPYSRWYIAHNYIRSGQPFRDQRFVCGQVYQPPPKNPLSWFGDTPGERLAGKRRATRSCDRPQSTDTTIQTELILQNIASYAKSTLASYTNPSDGAPDPSFVLQLEDENPTGSNIFAVQKTFDGKFQFDIYFESHSAKHKLSCKSWDCRAVFD